MKNIVIIVRGLSKTGGRITFVKSLIKNKPKDVNLILIEYFQQSLYNFHKSSYKKIKDIEKTKKIDLILGVGVPALGGMLYAKKYRIPSIFSISGIRGKHVQEVKKIAYTFKSSKPSFFARLITFYRYVSEKWSMKIANHILVPSDFCKKIIVRAHPQHKKKILVIPEGTAMSSKKDFSNASLLKRNGLSKPIITFFKTPDSIFEGCKAFLRQETSKMTIINVFPNRPIYAYTGNSFKKVNLNVKEAFQISDLVIGLPQSEQHSCTVIETMILKKPVLLSKVGWIREELKGLNNILIDKLIPRDIVYRITSFFHKKNDVVRESNKAAKRLLKKYDSNKSSKEFYELVEKLT